MVLSILCIEGALSWRLTALTAALSSLFLSIWSLSDALGTAALVLIEPLLTGGTPEVGVVESGLVEELRKTVVEEWLCLA